MDLQQAESREQHRYAGICPGVHTGQFPNSVEPELDRVRVHAKASRGLLHVEAAVGKCADGAHQFAPLVIVGQVDLTYPRGTRRAAALSDRRMTNSCRSISEKCMSG